MTLEEFHTILKSTADSFTSAYQDGINKSDPNSPFPTEMEEEDWWEQFLFFLNM